MLTEVEEMVYFKACPRCLGDMHINRDMFGKYKECLQCGYMVDIEQPKAVAAAPVARAKRKAA